MTYGTPCASAGDCHSGYDCIPISEPGGWGEPCLTGSDCLVGYSCDIWNGVCLSSACSTQGSTAQCIEGQVCSCIDVVVNIGDSGCWCLPNICAPPSCEENGSNVGCPAGHTCACFDENCYCAPTGDPALILHAAAEQYRNEYVFLTPDKYVEDYVNIVAPGDATVTLDNVPVGAGYFSAITGSTYKVARLKVGDGVHRISADQPVGVVVYGFDRDVSYGYVAGLNLQKLSSE